MFVDCKNAVLLQTAKAYISRAENPGQSTVVRFIFDSGSQWSHISKRLKDFLALPSISQETLMINRFASDKGNLQTCDITQFCLTSPYNLNMYVNAYVVPIACSPLKSQPINFATSNIDILGGYL